MSKPLQIFIGYDSREAIAYHVLAHSILRRASIPVTIAPVALNLLEGIYTRERGETESTEFSLSRFLVPHLSGYQGHSVFLDCDMLCLSDIALLQNEIKAQPDKAVLCVKHDYTPKHDVKFMGQRQTAYPRKNWSSMMVLNNERCQALTRAYVNQSSGLELHRFMWIEDQDIGGLHQRWNWLVGEYNPNPKAHILHYTEGGPWFFDYRECDHAGLWLAERDHMLNMYPGSARKFLEDVPE